MRSYFCGWYFKCQNETKTIALIPAYHISGGKRQCSIQVITEEASWNVTFPYQEFRMNASGAEIGANRFSRDGVHLDLHTPGLDIKGKLSFGSLTPIRYDIMGPFRYVPFLECRHSVFSMKHSVNGTLIINEMPVGFTNGTGYMEGDRGSSFPKEYFWTQCLFPEGSLMLSVADIPLCGCHFTGVIGIIHYQGREYRIATYLGAKAVSICRDQIVVKQGRRQLTVRLLEKRGLPLAAPVSGNMTRTIHEAAACRTSFDFQDNGKTIFSFESDKASFEYEYHNTKSGK